MIPEQNVVPDGNNKEPEGLRVSSVVQSFLSCISVKITQDFWFSSVVIIL